ncbi:hypothetical protein [Syntrophomonas erecta]
MTDNAWEKPDYVSPVDRSEDSLEKFIKGLAARIITRLDEIENEAGLNSLEMIPDGEIRYEAQSLKGEIQRLKNCLLEL